MGPGHEPPPDLGVVPAGVVVSWFVAPREAKEVR